MEVRRKNHFHSTALRAEALNILHKNQIENLKQWRSPGISGGEKEKLLNQLLISVNAIANAMGATG